MRIEPAHNRVLLPPRHELILEDRTRGLIAGEGVIRVPWVELPRRGVMLHWKIEVRSHESGELLWVRPFRREVDALRCYLQLIGYDIERVAANLECLRVPGIWTDGELDYLYATVTTYTTTTNNSGATWLTGGTSCPSGVSVTDYLVLAGGGCGGKHNDRGGGGGAGAMRPGTSLAVVAGTNYPVTVGLGGTTDGAAGGNSVFSSITSTGGGFGGGTAGGTTGGNGGSGGGGSSKTGGTSGGTGTTGGNNGGGGAYGAEPYSGGGGGGAGAVGTSAGSGQPGNGAIGSSSSISGSAVTYAAGGGGSGNVQPGGNGGSSIGGNGGYNGAAPTNATAQRGSGGGGLGAAGTNSGTGSDGIVILSFVQIIPKVSGNMAMLGM